MKTKILATLGPTLSTEQDITGILKQGVKSFRIHMGLRTRDFCGYYKTLADTARQLNENIEVFLDLPSSRPRVASMKERLFQVEEIVTIKDTTTPESGAIIPLPKLTSLLKNVKSGERIMFRDGKIVFQILEMGSEQILVKCISSIVN